MEAMRQAFVGAGANLGDREATLRETIACLEKTSGVRRVICSSFYETAPIGFTEQPPFLNLVAGLETSLEPDALLSVLQQLERKFGRERFQRWGPRTLDLDLLAFEGVTRADATLCLPHPRMFERAFVLVPLGEVLAQPVFRTPRWDELRERVGSARGVGDVRRWP